MATIAQLAHEAAETDKLRAMEEAFELADLMSPTPMDFATYLEAIQTEKEKAKEAQTRKRKERAVVAERKPQIHQPPFAVPRSFDLGAICVTYQPKTIRKLIVRRPPRSEYTIPNFIRPMLPPSVFSQTAERDARHGDVWPASAATSPTAAQGREPHRFRDGQFDTNQTTSPWASSPTGSFVASRGYAPPPLMLNPHASTQSYRLPKQNLAAAALDTNWDKEARGRSVAVTPPPPTQTHACGGRPLEDRCAVDSDVVILHGLYKLPESLVQHLGEYDQQLREEIEQLMARLCAPYGVRASLDRFVKAMYNAATPGHSNQAQAPRASIAGAGVRSAANTVAFPIAGSPTFGPSVDLNLSMTSVSVALGGGLTRGVSFRKGGLEMGDAGMASPNASFAFTSGGLPTLQQQQQQQPPLTVIHTVPTLERATQRCMCFCDLATGSVSSEVHRGIRHVPSLRLCAVCAASSNETSSGNYVNDSGRPLRSLVEVPNVNTIGKGGHWDSATNLKVHIDRTEATAASLRNALKELFDRFGDEPLFGPLIGFELNHAIVLWGHVKARLITRRKMAEFRDRREFFDDKSAAVASALALSSAGGDGGRDLGVFSRRGSSLALLTTASATLARYGGVLGALSFICKNLLLNPREDLADTSIVPITLHYAIARAQANASLTPASGTSGGGGGTAGDPFNQSFAGGGFNPNASFRKVSVGSPTFGGGGGQIGREGPGVTLICSRDNAVRISNLVSALFAALEAFRWEFDVFDESVLTIEAIEAGILIALRWLRGVYA